MSSLPETFVSFLDANPGVSRDLNVSEEDNPRLVSYLTRIKCPAYYRDGGVRTVRALYTRPGTGYSWPGHVSDRTEAGVLAHELGHHVHLSSPDALRVTAKFPWRREQVTSYERSRRGYEAEEAFAETFRLFLLNPSLLSEGRPERYRFLERELGLVTVETRHWRQVLSDAPAHMSARVLPWIARK